MARIGKRTSNRVYAQAVASSEGESLQSFIRDYAGEETVICMDWHGGCRQLVAGNGSASGVRSE